MSCNQEMHFSVFTFWETVFFLQKVCQALLVMQVAHKQEVCKPALGQHAYKVLMHRKIVKNILTTKRKTC